MEVIDVSDVWDEPKFMYREQLHRDLLLYIKAQGGTRYDEANAELNEVKKIYDGKINGSSKMIQAEPSCSFVCANDSDD